MPDTEINKYKIADGYYLRDNLSQERENETTFRFYYISHQNLRSYSLYAILGCEKPSEHIILQEADIQKAIESIYPSFAYNDALGDLYRNHFELDELVENLVRNINKTTPKDSPKVKLIKLEKDDGTANYYMADKYNDLKPVSFLHENLPLEDPQTMEKILAYNEIGWCVINATSKQLAAKMEARGYVLEYSGNSGFESRNRYIIKTQDDILTPEIYQKMEEDLAACKIERKQEKLQAFDEYFDEQSTDKAKVYAIVETGYDYNLTRIIDEEKYERIAKVCIAYTSDHRQGYDHTYAELLIHKDRIKQDKRKFITIEVPKSMIGLIIGKKGSNIKALQQKFGKNFNIVQDPKEIAAEKQRQQEEAARKHQYDLQSLQSNIKEFMGENFMASDDDSIAVSMVEYITNNKDKLAVHPTQEELQQMKENLIIERDDEIKRENDRKAREIAEQKRLEQERIAEQKRLEQEKMAEITQAVKTHVQTWADEHNGTVLPNEELVKFIKETYQEDTLAQKFTAAIQKDFLLKMEAERAMQQRAADAEKRFTKVVSEEFQKFFENDYDSQGHGYNYFNIVGKARRADGYDIIATRVERRLGIYDDLRKPLEERLLDHRPQEDRWSSYLDEDIKFRDRIVDFNENVGNFEEYMEQQQQKAAPKPDIEPTIENLTMLWGAKKGKLK